jgi:hypothetical protein
LPLPRQLAPSPLFRNHADGSGPSCRQHACGAGGLVQTTGGEWPRRVLPT